MKQELLISEISQRIHIIRGKRVMLDRDLADLYGFSPKRLNEQVRRNSQRFPEDFVFQLVQAEFDSLRSQIATLDIGRGKYQKYLPWVFTEQGVAMLSSVLKSGRAIEVNIAITRTFVDLRQKASSPIEFQKSQDLYSAKLDGLENKLDLLLSRFQSPITIEAPEPEYKIIGGAIKRGSNPKIEIIQNAVAQHFGLSLNDLKSNTRRPTIALPRQVAMYLIRKHMGIGFKEIGRSFGGKDHTTILHACHKIENHLRSDKMMSDAVDLIRKSCGL